MTASRVITTALLVLPLAGWGGSIGQPASGRHVRSTRPATVELWAPRPGGGAGVVLLFFPGSRVDPRDVCMGTLRQRQSLLEADEYCGVVTPTDFWAFATWDGAIGGFAPSGVTRIKVRGAGGTLRLPLSRRRAFLALYPRQARGRVVVSARYRDGRVRRHQLRLPPPRGPAHPRRRAGAVFGDDVGETIIGVSERRLLRRFGPPLHITSGAQPGCVYYEDVGDITRGWTLCFGPDHRVASAAGGRIPPHERPD